MANGGSGTEFMLFGFAFAGCVAVIVMHVMTNWPLVKGNRTAAASTHQGS
ncbi:unnamed protein product [Symbiodinium natans]|uniref:Uncharacterized protein n=1 Tax=Symbiodinium natans TaxID=878477 RepID=A0A812TPN6_9DINO|nr:unnamed protein product [Symbiodinium natans]